MLAGRKDGGLGGNGGTSEASPSAAAAAAARKTSAQMADLHKLAQAMCSIDLIDSHWTQELPRLPVPDLWLTVSRYLASLKAVLAPSELASKHKAAGLSQEQILANRRQFERTDALVKQFMLNEGPQLQRDLKEYANKCQNWATEYWLQDMYLSNPLPLPVNSNPFFMFPRQQFATSEEMLMFATRIIQFSVDFKYRIDQQTLKQDYGSGHGKGKPLCMETYKNFFHSYRMPHEDMDRLLPQSRRSNHIVVASCNQFYILRLGQDPLDNPYRKDASSQLNEASIFDQLLRIYRVSREHAKRELSAAGSQPSASQLAARIPKVGLFTTENRKTWARLHKKLTHCTGPQVLAADDSQTATAAAAVAAATASGTCSPTTNTESLRQIEDCLFVMCLDSLVKPPTSVAGQQQQPRAPPPALDQAACELDTEAANIILTGGGSRLFTANRWFDKFLQIIVGRDGVCGINIEHSASEGITVLRFLEDFLEFIRANPVRVACAEAAAGRKHQLAAANKQHFTYQQQQQQQPPPPPTETAESITSPGYVEPKSPSVLLEESDKMIVPLKWQLDDELYLAIDDAESRANQLVENFSLNILNFTRFGRTFIKSQNLSPDAFLQLALQYTFFKIHGFLVSTYESASLRQFRLGRVDNIRANTCEAYDWIQEMLECKRTTMHDATATTPALAAPAAGVSSSSSKWRPAEGAFIKAITRQVEILRYTIVGGAPDNHLLALKQLANIRYDDELPELFTDESYKEFLRFRLSTSQLPNESGITVGYGAVTPDGYGCSYNPCPDRVVFCISTFVDCPETSSSRFAATLEESLLEMQELCLGR